MEYMKVFVDFAKSMDTLADAEKGRLFVAMLEYTATGTEPQLSGNERHVWPTAKLHLDRTFEEHARKSMKLSENGKKGGRPSKAKKANGFSENQKDFQESKKSQDKDKDKDKDKDNIPPLIPPEGGNARAKFARPKLEDIAAYCRERGNGIDAQHFYDYYESNGWRVGKTPMKDWRATVRNWERRDERGGTGTNQRVDASFSGNAF